ncbi:MAG: hypothetical protein ACLUKN_08105 [Bacilli bacterium]
MRQWRPSPSTARAGWRRLSELPQGFITNTRRKPRSHKTNSAIAQAFK